MSTSELTPKERCAWLQLTRTENVGPITFRQLLRRYGSPQKALEVLPELARRGGGKTLKPPTVMQIETEIAALEKRGGRLIAQVESAYPAPLAAVEDAPPLIAVLGQASVLQKRCVGIVGARNASLNGRKMAERLARDVGAQDFVIVSGLARGIDTAAHQASLSTGTVAVLAGGVDVVYPEENRALYEKIMETGAVISEQPTGTEPRAQLFPRRNRLISGLSLGVIVVEAARQSGSLITARMALEQGREVFAVPGSPLDPRAEGPNDLLRQGAILTEKAADVLQHIYSLPRLLAENGPDGRLETPPPTENEADLELARQKITENLSPAPVLVDELVRGCHLSLPLVLTVLLELELAGRIERQPGNRVAMVG